MSSKKNLVSTGFATIIQKRFGIYDRSFSKCILLVFYLILMPDISLASQPYYYTYYKPKKKTTPLPHPEDYAGSSEEDHANFTGLKTPVDRNMKTSWGGWKPPPEVEAEWNLWYQDYLRRRNGTDYLNAQDKNKFADERGPGSGWPMEWHGLGEGMDGVDVPPWAYVPKQSGRPSICYESPRRGRCRNPVTKWGFNPYTEECQEYIYGGCDPSGNMFATKEECEVKCALSTGSTCSGDSGIPVDYSVIYHN